MLLLLIAAAAFFLMVVAAGLLEAWARHRHWQGFDDRPLKYDRRRRMGRPW